MGMTQQHWHAKRQNIPLSLTKNTFPWWTTNINSLFMKTQFSVYSQKYQLTHFAILHSNHPAKLYCRTPKMWH